jgi:hypothetical protein
MTEFKDGPSYNFDLSNEEHARFLFGSHGPAISKRVRENPLPPMTVTVSSVNASTNTIYLAPKVRPK